MAASLSLVEPIFVPHMGTSVIQANDGFTRR
jgi:hypothetical protein